MSGTRPPTADLQGAPSESGSSAPLTDPSIGRGPIDRWFHDHYGGKKGCARALQHGLKHVLGAYRRDAHVDAACVRRVVFVCVGNICRSPYGEAVARSHGLRSASFGLEARTGDPANHNARVVASARGVDLESHRATGWGDFEAAPGDLLLGSEPGHTDRLRERYRDRADLQIALLGLFARPRRAYLHDPYGLGPAYFARCYDRIDSAVGGLVGLLHGAGDGAFEAGSVS